MIDKDAVKKLIESSGMITHKKAIDILRGEDWKLLIGPYYYDNISNTVREIDIIAEKQFYSAPQNPTQSSIQVNVQLFIECKYIKHEIVLWFDNKDIDKAVSKMEKNSGLKILHKRYGADITTDKFHYLSNDKVAKIFSSSSNKEDVIYKALTQCLNAQIYYDQWYNQPLHFGFSQYKGTNTKILKYPMIICDNFNNLIKIDFDSNNNSYKNKSIDSSFQVETNYIFLDKEKKAKSDYFLIDVLNIIDMMPFLDNLEKEINSVILADPNR